MGLTLVAATSSRSWPHQESASTNQIRCHIGTHLALLRAEASFFSLPAGRPLTRAHQFFLLLPFLCFTSKFVCFFFVSVHPVPPSLFSSFARLPIFWTSLCVLLKPRFACLLPAHHPPPAPVQPGGGHARSQSWFKEGIYFALALRSSFRRPTLVSSSSLPFQFLSIPPATRLSSSPLFHSPIECSYLSLK